MNADKPGIRNSKTPISTNPPTTTSDNGQDFESRKKEMELLFKTHTTQINLNPSK